MNNSTLGWLHRGRARALPSPQGFRQATGRRMAVRLALVSACLTAWAPMATAQQDGTPAGTIKTLKGQVSVTRNGVAQRPIADMEEYRTELRARLNPTTSVLTLAYEAARANPKRIVFAEGEEEVVLRAGEQTGSLRFALQGGWQANAPEAILSANIGCMVQLGSASRVPVLDAMELSAAASGSAVLERAMEDAVGLAEKAARNTAGS